jgi:hypothetical protein
MVKITFPDGQTAITENPTFVRVHKENCFIICERDKAEGVVYKGCPFLYAEGTSVHDVDAGELFLTAEDMAAAIREGVNEV